MVSLECHGRKLMRSILFSCPHPPDSFLHFFCSFSSILILWELLYICYIICCKRALNSWVYWIKHHVAPHQVVGIRVYRSFLIITVWVNLTQTKNNMWGQRYLLIYCLYMCFYYSLQLAVCSEPHSLWAATTNSTINNWVRLLFCSKPFQNLKF